MNKKSVSIVIPVFNTRIDYFIRCLDSIKNNGLNKSKFEVIVVNDGMDDFSEYVEIIEDLLSSNDIKNKIIHNFLNMKQGYSRYVGLRAAMGDYVHFVDSDDEIFPNTYTTLIEYLNDEPNFVLFKELSLLTGQEGVQQDFVFKNLVNNIGSNELKNHLFLKEDIKKIRGGMNVVLHNKLFNRVWLLNNTKFWVPNLFAEDTLLTFEILLKTEKFKVCLDELYYYIIHIESTITSGKDNNKLAFDMLFVLDKILELIHLENRYDLKYLIIDSILGFYDYQDTVNWKGRFDSLFVEIFEKYDNFDYCFINKLHEEWFLNNQKIKTLFSQYILKENLNEL